MNLSADLMAIAKLTDERRALIDELGQAAAGLRQELAIAEDENAVLGAAVIRVREELGQAIGQLGGVLAVIAYVEEVLIEVAADPRVVTARAWLDAREQQLNR